MPEVLRFDEAEVRLDRAERLSNGWMRVPAVVGRVGVVEYEEAGGGRRREYRPPEEVFHADAMRSGEMVPVTNGHPPEELNAANTRHFAVGSSGTLRRDGDTVVTELLLTDASAIQAAMQGKIQISPGYKVLYDPTPGVTPEGERYDGIQRQPRINHYAQVWCARQGARVSMRLDSGDAIAASLAHPNAPKQGNELMKTIRIDGKDHEVPEEVAAALAKAESDLAAAAATTSRKDEADTQISKLQARLDALEEERRADRATEQARIDARVALVGAARKVIGDEYRADGKSDLQVMAEVVLAVDPRAKDKLEQRKDDRGYIEGRYEVALEHASIRNDHGARLLELAQQAGEVPKESDLEKSRARFDEDRTTAWKPNKAAQQAG